MPICQIQCVIGILLSLVVVSPGFAKPRHPSEQLQVARKHVAARLAQAAAPLHTWNRDITALADAFASDEQPEKAPSEFRQQVVALMAEGQGHESRVTAINEAFRTLTELLNRHRAVTPRDLATAARFRQLLGTWYSARRKLDALHKRSAVEAPEP